MQDTDTNDYLDPIPDEAQLAAERADADLDAEADRYEYFTHFDSFADYFAERPVLIEQANGTFTLEGA